jgi:membrane-associated protease RseP (regulator of RpoE activity)
VPPDARAVELRFLPPAIPAFRLAGYAEFARDRRVALEITGEDDRRDRFQPLRLEGDAIARDGTIDLGRLQPGTYLFRLFIRPLPGEPPSKWRTYDEREIAGAEFTFAAGPRTLEMPFPALSTLRISGMPLKKADYFLVPVEATPSDESRVFRHAEPDSDGVLVYNDVAPGTFEFRGPLEQTMLIETPAADVVRFVPDVIRVLRVTIVDPKGALARAGLATGDRIVAIDGREFESREELERVRQSLRGGDVTLTVARGGKRFEVVVSLALFRNPRDAGGSFAESPR